MSDTSASAAMTGAETGGVSGNVNAGVSFFLDCTVNLFLLSGLLIGVFEFPAEIVFSRIIPGSIMGVVVGNVIYAHYARKLRRETGYQSLTSLPAGADLPTIFGMVFFLLGPYFTENREALGDLAAATEAWKVGMAATLWMAGIKFILSFFSKAVQEGLPQMALIGAMAGIATVWLGAEAIFGVFTLPEVGIVSFFIMVYALIAGHKLPFQMPGAILAILIGTLLYYALAAGGFGNGYEVRALPSLTPALPLPTLQGVTALGGDVTRYLGIVVPLALLITASSINVVAGAQVIGDVYDCRYVVKVDALATAVTALFGGVVQTTPYFGHATYKRMGARSGYSLGAAAVIGVGGFAGVIALAAQAIPEAVLRPILVVVASDILRLAFTAGDIRHAPAFLFAIVPAILNYAHTKVSELYGQIGEAGRMALSADWVAGYALLGAMSRGYILTSLIWAAMLVWIVDRRLVRAAMAAFTAAVFTSFGVIHSVLPSSGMYVPWSLPDTGGGETLAIRLALGYTIAGLMLMGFGALKDSDTAA